MKRTTNSRPAGLGAVLARVFWALILCRGILWVYDCYQAGEWPWDLFRSREIAGVTLLHRSSWQARPEDGSPGDMARPRKVTIHHSGGKAIGDLDQAATARTIKAIQDDHMKRRHWNDIGYHYVVDRSGRVWEGRSATRTGAHAGSAAANRGNIGILVLGNFDIQAPTQEQLAACERLVDGLLKKHRLTKTDVEGHDEVRRGAGLGDTSCPGKQLAAWLERYKGLAVRQETPQASGDRTSGAGATALVDF